MYRVGSVCLKVKLLPGLYGADDISVDDVIETESVKVTVEMIDKFAALTGDDFEIHMDADAARRHGFEARVAHGLLVLSLVDGLKNRAHAKIRGRASLGWNWRFKSAVFAEDSVRASITIREKRITRRLDQTILTLEFEVFNQHGRLVQSGENLLLAYN